MQRRPIKERFMEKFFVNETNGCWEWQAALHDQGYGMLWDADLGKMERAHRVSWVLFRGPIPSDLCVLHRCDNRPCVNPEHLFVGTVLDNNLDMLKKGRAVFP